jgi:hypothetical protein
MQNSETGTKSPLNRREGMPFKSSPDTDEQCESVLVTPESILVCLMGLGFKPFDQFYGVEFIAAKLEESLGAFRIYYKEERKPEGVDGDTGGSSGAVDAPGEAQPEHGEISGAAQ